MDTRNSQVRRVIQEVAGHSLTRRANVIGDACIRLEGRLRPPPRCSHPEGCVDGILPRMRCLRRWSSTPLRNSWRMTLYIVTASTCTEYYLVLSRFVANVSGPLQSTSSFVCDAIRASWQDMNGIPRCSISSSVSRTSDAVQTIKSNVTCGM